MAIVRMSKFSLIAFETQKSQILKSLQKFREVHFIDLAINEEMEESALRKVVSSEELNQINERLNGVENAIRLLRKYHVSEKGIKAMMKGSDNYTFNQLSEKSKTYDWKSVCEELKALGNRHSSLESQISKKFAEVDELSVWNRLDINPDDLKKLKSSDTYLGFVPFKLKSEFIKNMSELQYTYYEELKVSKDDVYYLIISAKEENEKQKLGDIMRNTGFTVAELDIDETPADYISRLRSEIEVLKAERHEVKNQIKSYDSELGDLEAVSEYLRNKKLRIETSEKMIRTENVCFINGWIPSEKVNEFEKAVKDVTGENCYISYEEAEKDDEEVPIKLKNGPLASTFESLTGMYAYPKYNEIDPTPLIAPFYIIFFGMMGADVGYGAVLLLASFLVLKFFNLNRKTKSLVQFFFYLSFSVIIWGAVYGSYFGFPLIKGLVDPANEYTKLLILSVIFGIIHIYFGLGLKAYLLIKEKKPLDAVYDVLFWYMALSGGILYLTLTILNQSPSVAMASGIVSVIGMIGIVLTGGREAKSAGGKLGGGLYSLYGISGYVGDFVSYSRLMALGLSGGFIAQAINMIIGMVKGSPIGWIFVPLIFAGGHFFNMFLSFLGGYVHTSRLMYVEFFGKFYEGGGKPFKDFRTEDKYVNIED